MLGFESEFLVNLVMPTDDKRGTAFLFSLTAINVVKQVYSGFKVSRLIVVFFRDGSAYFSL